MKPEPHFIVSVCGFCNGFDKKGKLCRMLTRSHLFAIYLVFVALGLFTFRFNWKSREKENRKSNNKNMNINNPTIVLGLSSSGVRIYPKTGQN